MNNQIVIITEQEVLGKQFRVYGEYENPLFLAKDVAEWIEHSNPRVMLQSIDDNEKVVNNVYTPGGVQESWFLTEDGLYEVLMLSRKPIAKEFKKQVKEILKNIRKNGMYAKEELLDNPDLLLDVIAKLKVEREEKLAAQRKLEIQAPKVEAYNTMLDSKNAMYIREVAKLLNSPEWGEKRLFRFLKNAGVLMENNEPYQKYIDKGYFRVIARTYKVYDEVRTSKTTLVLPKGIDYILKLVRI